MSVWDAYENRVTTRGDTLRELSLNREVQMLSKKISESLSGHTVTIDQERCEVAIVNSDNLDEKSIYSLDKSIIKGGSLVQWMDSFWLVVEQDANNEVYTKAKMRRCNHLLKWIDSEGVIHQQWCIIEDGTKYLTGEYEDRQFIVTRGDSRISMTISRNEHTVKFSRKNRFLIDDPDSESKLSYMLTKPLKVGNIYDGEGVYCFVLQEVVSTDNDNHELGIADYYKYFVKQSGSESDVNNMKPVINPEETLGEDGRQVWL